jgi:RNA polymerase sigma-70 factor (ECF subfamily)
MTDWSEIVEQHGPVVWKTVWRLLKRDADAADCFQATFLSAWKLSQAEPVRHWPALLKRLATARALERLRVRCREADRTSSLPDEVPARRNVVTPIDSASAGELAEQLREALAELDDQRLAQVFCLTCLEELSYREVAEQLGLTVTHVGVLLNRARSLLRERLRSHAPPRDARASEKPEVDHER